MLLFFLLFFYGYKLLLLTFAAWATPRVGQVFKLRSGRYAILGVAHFWVVSVLARALELCHDRMCFRLKIRNGEVWYLLLYQASHSDLPPLLMV